MSEHPDGSCYDNHCPRCNPAGSHANESDAREMNTNAERAANAAWAAKKAADDPPRQLMESLEESLRSSAALWDALAQRDAACQEAAALRTRVAELEAQRDEADRRLEAQVLDPEWIGKTKSGHITDDCYQCVRHPDCVRTDAQQWHCRFRSACDAGALVAGQRDAAYKRVAELESALAAEQEARKKAEAEAESWRKAAAGQAHLHAEVADALADVTAERDALAAHLARLTEAMRKAIADATDLIRVGQDDNALHYLLDDLSNALAMAEPAADSVVNAEKEQKL